MNKLAPYVVAALAAGGLAAACTVNSTTTNNGQNDGGIQQEDGGTADSGPTNEAAADVTPEAAPPPSTEIRFANWSPDAPSAGYDLCISPHGANQWTEILGTITGDAGTIGDGGMSSLQFPTVTNYSEFDFLAPDGGNGADTASFDFEIIQEGGNCSSPVTTATTDLPAFNASAFYTVAIVGDTSTSGTNDPGLKIVALSDDQTAVSGALLRFINAGPSVASADFGTGSIASSNFTALLTGVPFGQAPAPAVASGDGGTADAGATDAAGGSGNAVDANGYLMLSAGSSTFSVHPSGQTNTDTAIASNQSLGGGDITTMVLIGAKSGAMTKPAFLVCKGDGPTTEMASTLVTVCSTVSM